MSINYTKVRQEHQERLSAIMEGIKAAKAINDQLELEMENLIRLMRAKDFERSSLRGGNILDWLRANGADYDISRTRDGMPMCRATFPLPNNT